MQHIPAVALAALVTLGVLAAPPAALRAGPASSEGAFFVTSVTPGRYRDVLPDFSDPGLNGRITVRFSSPVLPADVIDGPGTSGPLEGTCELRDHRYAAVPASASVRRNLLVIDPTSAERPLLPPGCYTLTLQSSIRSADGRRLNGGGADFTTSFLVGRDLYAPVLRRVAPLEGRTAGGRRRGFVATFDEPVDPQSAAAALRLEDRGTSPPTPIPARVRVARGGLAVVVTPESRAGLPRSAGVTLVIAGRAPPPASPAVLTDALGNPFERDASPRWVVDPEVPTLFHASFGEFDELTGEFTSTLRTRARSRAARR